MAAATVAVPAPLPLGKVFSTTPAAQPPPGQPDIAYHPDWDKYQARAARRTQTEDLPKTLPEGFPKELKAEIDSALAHFKSLNLAKGYITQETFPLPKLHAELRRLSHELHFGHGFFVIRGLDVDKYTREENIIIYTGVSSHIGSIRGRQDAYFEGKRADVVVGHVKDVRSGLGENRDKEKVKIGTPAYTADKQVFHTDSGDIVSLFALSTAAEGAPAVWLARGVFTKTVDDKDKFMSRPLLYHQPASADAPRSSHLPPITEAQAEALDALHFLGERFSVSTNFEKGDMQYVNNVAIFHARDGFTDTPDKQRHLLRQWLRDPENAWETPNRSPRDGTVCTAA
uniref:TauD/TfdA-like domain-containing protein n=1 Tax=Bionectria ochroleuca TaxID=29856 RepID=A0A8H7TU94_BIOOC